MGMARRLLLVLMSGWLISTAFPVGQGQKGQVSFPEPVRISGDQAALLRRAAEQLDQSLKTLKTSLLPLESQGSFTRARDALITYTGKGADNVRATQTEFAKLTRNQQAAEASEVYFSDIRDHYAEAWKGLKELEKPDRNSYPAVRDKTIWALEHNSKAYAVAASKGTLTFDLAVRSDPQDGSVSFKRKGDDDYSPHPDPTNTTIKNLVYAVWYVKVQRDGYQDQEKQHDATREERHELDFKLKPK